MALGFNEKMEPVLKPGVLVGCGEERGGWEVFIWGLYRVLNLSGGFWTRAPGPGPPAR